MLASPDLAGAMAGAHRATRELQPTIVEARGAVTEARGLIRELDVRVKSIGGDSETTLREMRETLELAQNTLEALERTLSGADEARVRAAGTFEELERAMKAIRNLLDYIQTHPEAMLQGKPQSKEKK